MRSSGRLITIEGINAAGKTTQTNLIFRSLKRLGYNVCSFKSPNYETEIGKILQDVITEKVVLPLHTMFVLFSANRLEMKPIIENELAANKLIFQDRYSESEYAYGLASGLPKFWLMALESQMPRADAVLVLDIDSSIALERIDSIRKRDFFEKKKFFLEKVRNQYLQLVAKPPYPEQFWKIFDSSRSILSVHKAIRDTVIDLLDNFPI